MSPIPVTLVWFTHFLSNRKREFVVQENKVFYVKKWRTITRWTGTDYPFGAHELTPFGSTFGLLYCAMSTIVGQFAILFLSLYCLSFKLTLLIILWYLQACLITYWFDFSLVDIPCCRCEPHDIAELLLKMALSTNQSINQSVDIKQNIW